MHGRSRPPARRDQTDAFAAALAGWEWQLALLQEVPPWWPEELASRLGAGYARALTSRNALLPLRRAVAVRWPDLIKSNGGGANSILVRGGALRIAEHRTLRLAVWPERRWLHAVRLATEAGELWAGNLHTSGRGPNEPNRAREAMLSWAGSAPLILGGDFNLPELTLPGLRRSAAHGVDYIFASGLEPLGAAEVIDRDMLSDHAPVAVTLAAPG